MKNKFKIIFGKNIISLILKYYLKNIKIIFYEKKKKYFIKKIKNKNLIFKKKNKIFLNKICGNNYHQGIVSIIKKIKINKNIKKIIKNKKKKKIFLILNKINNINNLGSCIRTSNALNIDLIILSKKCINKNNKIILKTSLGANLITPYIKVKSIKKIIKYLKKKNFKIIGT